MLQNARHACKVAKSAYTITIEMYLADGRANRLSIHMHYIYVFEFSSYMYMFVLSLIVFSLFIDCYGKHFVAKLISYLL